MLTKNLYTTFAFTFSAWRFKNLKNLKNFSFFVLEETNLNYVHWQHKNTNEKKKDFHLHFSEQFLFDLMLVSWNFFLTSGVHAKTELLSSFEIIRII